MASKSESSNAASQIKAQMWVIIEDIEDKNQLKVAKIIAKLDDGSFNVRYLTDIDSNGWMEEFIQINNVGEDEVDELRDLWNFADWPFMASAMPENWQKLYLTQQRLEQLAADRPRFHKYLDMWEKFNIIKLERLDSKVHNIKPDQIKETINKDNTITHPIDSLISLGHTHQLGQIHRSENPDSMNPPAQSAELDVPQEIPQKRATASGGKRIKKRKTKRRTKRKRRRRKKRKKKRTRRRRR